MSETNGGHWDEPPDEQDEPRGPYRVIGTPPPAQARTLLGEARQASAEPVVRELPAGPDDEKKAKGAERIVATLFLISLLASIGFIAAYVALPVHSLDNVFRSNLWLGLTMAIAFGTVAMGAAVWVKVIMPHVELVEARKPLASTAEARAAFEKTFTEGAEASGFTKRPMLRRTLIAASAGLAIAPIVVLRDMGPLPGTSLRHTVWRKGMRLIVYGPNTPIRPADFAIPGQMITVVPQGYQDNQDALAKAVTIIIKFGPGQLIPDTPQTYGTKMNWTVDNIVAYSKICTHVGCPVALYEETTHHILCPCHQSTFDATRGAAVIFGPAARPLPQLPLGVDAEGYLVATHDYDEPVGPSFWERG
jgi:quinol---cytochrome c reductase iron-sulfur subunit